MICLQRRLADFLAVIRLVLRYSSLIDFPTHMRTLLLNLASPPVSRRAYITSLYTPTLCMTQQSTSALLFCFSFLLISLLVSILYSIYLDSCSLLYHVFPTAPSLLPSHQPSGWRFRISLLIHIIHYYYSFTPSLGRAFPQFRFV